MIRRLHRWLGLALAGYLIVVAASGALLLWSAELLHAAYPAVGELTPAALERLSTDADPATTVVLPGRAKPVLHVYRASGAQQLADPASGEILREWNRSTSVLALLFELHVDLLAGDVGHNLAGALGIVTLLTFALGLRLFLKRRKTRLLQRMVPRSLRRTDLLRSHASQGALLLPLTALVVFSGVAMIYSGPVQNALVSLLGSNGPLRPTTLSVSHANGPIDWQQQLETAQQALPESEVRMVFVPLESGKPVVWRLRAAGEWHPNGRSYLAVHPESAEVLEIIDARRTGFGPAVFNALYPLHSGSTGWFGHRPALLLLSLSLLFMAFSGVRSYWLVRPVKRPKQFAQDGSTAGKPEASTDRSPPDTVSKPAREPRRGQASARA